MARAGGAGAETPGAAAEAFANWIGEAPTEDLARFAAAWALDARGEAAGAAAAGYRATPAGRLRHAALQRLSGLCPLTPNEDRELAAAGTVERGQGVEAADFCFVLGAVLDSRGLWDEAFAAFQQGNALIAARLDLPRAEAQDIVRHDSMRRTFTAEFLRARAGRGHPSTAPIFVVGMPRSGSTLIEQILATHPGVQGMGEPDALSQVVRAQFPVNPLADEPPDHYRRMGAQYLARLRAAGWDGKRKFVDKFPPNYLSVGLIALIFPRAVILHSVRDAADACLSNYRHRFFVANELTYDLAYMGRSYVRYRRLMEHWATVLPGRVIDVANEGLVADPQGRIRWLVTEACRLTWSERCLAFDQNPRPVTTLSRHQVRRPIFTTSVGRWRQYEKHLAPLMAALDPYAP